MSSLMSSVHPVDFEAADSTLQRFKRMIDAYCQTVLITS